MNALRHSVLDLLNGVLTLGENKYPLDQTPENFSTYATTCIPRVDNDQLNQLLQAYRDVFCEKGTPVSIAKDAPPATINTGDHPPIKQQGYRLPLKKREKVEKLIDEMLADGVIQPSDSPWAFPITLAPKKDGTTRFCVDYRKLNTITRKDAHPLPHIQDVFDQLHGATIFSTLDLKAGYWQIPMDRDSIAKTAFTCHRGLFEFTRLPFGLTNAPAIFQRTMNKVLSGLIGRCCMVYIDDVVVFSKTTTEHLQHLEQVFQRLRSAGLQLKPTKCSFLLEEVELLGHRVSGRGISPLPEKVEAIKNMAPPQTQTGVRSFLGMAGYYRECIPGFATLAVPLTEVSAASKPFYWGEEQQTSFDALKEALSAAPILAHPDPSKPYTLYTDASDKTIGAILVQKDENNMERPIHYLSHKLTGSQLNWSTIEKEAYAVVYALKKLHAYLWGATFEIHTDHKPLKSLFQSEIKNTKLQRWAIQISEYGAPILYHPGKLNVRADMLSRIASLTPAFVASLAPVANGLPTVWETDGIDPLELQRLQRQQFPDECTAASQDEETSYVYENQILYSMGEPSKGAGRYPRLLLPQQYRGQVIDRAHGEIGHAGFAKTLIRVQDNYVWPGMRRHIREYLATCSRCRALTPPNQQNVRGKMPTPPAPNHTWGIDLVGPFPRDKTGKQYLLTAVDHLTGWAVAVPIASKKNALVWETFNTHVVAQYGLPTVLVSDNGGEFTHHSFEAWLREMGIEHRLTSPYHPQANGACERFNGTLQRLLLKLSGGDSRKWTHFLPEALYAYRIAPGPFGVSPYEALYGQKPRMPRSSGGHPTQGERLEALHAAAACLREGREKVKDQRTAAAPSSVVVFKPGDFVSLRAMAPTKGQPKWLPGYQVTSAYQGGLRLVEITTGKVVRVNQERVRLLPAQKPYDEIDPIPQVETDKGNDLPIQGTPIPVPLDPYIPMAPAAALRSVPQNEWSTWLDFVWDHTQ